MNKKHLYLAIGFACYLLIGCSDQSKNGEGEFASSAQSYNLSKTDIERLQGLAKSGGTEAAIRLGNYYASIARDDASSLYWFEMAANGGDINAINTTSMFYIKKNTEVDCKKAIEWLNKAILLANGDEQTIERYQLRSNLSALHWDGKNCSR